MNLYDGKEVYADENVVYGWDYNIDTTQTQQVERSVHGFFCNMSKVINEELVETLPHTKRYWMPSADGTFHHFAPPWAISQSYCYGPRGQKYAVHGKVLCLDDRGRTLTFDYNEKKLRSYTTSEVYEVDISTLFSDPNAERDEYYVNAPASGLDPHSSESKRPRSHNCYQDMFRTRDEKKYFTLLDDNIFQLANAEYAYLTYEDRDWRQHIVKIDMYNNSINEVYCEDEHFVVLQDKLKQVVPRVITLDANVSIDTSNFYVSIKKSKEETTTLKYDALGISIEQFNDKFFLRDCVRAPWTARAAVRNGKHLVKFDGNVFQLEKKILFTSEPHALASNEVEAPEFLLARTECNKNLYEFKYLTQKWKLKGG